MYGSPNDAALELTVNPSCDDIWGHVGPIPPDNLGASLAYHLCRIQHTAQNSGLLVAGLELPYELLSILGEQLETIGRLLYGASVGLFPGIKPAVDQIVTTLQRALQLLDSAIGNWQWVAGLALLFVLSDQIDDLLRSF